MDNERPAGAEARWETWVQAAAASLPYPPTPDLAGAVARRLAGGGAPARRTGYRLRWALAALAVALAALLAVPQVRAAVIEALRIGAVRILVAPPTATPSPAAPTRGAAEAPLPPATAVPTPLSSLLDLAGQTTLSAALRALPFALRLPAYPADLGRPDAVFLQEMNGKVAVLVWLEPGRPARVRLGLYEMAAGTYIEKLQPANIQETQVGGRRAVWAEGPYFLVSRDGSAETRRLVEGHALVWTDGDITFRLETNAGLDEARRIAESLQPLP